MHQTGQTRLITGAVIVINCSPEQHRSKGDRHAYVTIGTSCRNAGNATRFSRRLYQ